MSSIKTHNSHFDVAVIGSGPGGAVAAYHLARAGAHVVLIEEGSASTGISAFSIEEVQAKYRNAGLTAAIGSPMIPYIEARCLGGGSDINSGLYQRCPEEILQEWRDVYQVQDLERSLKEQYDLLEKEFFEANMGFQSGAADKLQRAAENLCWKNVEIPQLKMELSGNQLIRKKSMRETYIPNALKAGCELLCESRVEKLLQKRDGTWQLLIRKKNNDSYFIRAKYVFVCAGAIHTPALLLKSGIHHNVGKTLAMHPSAKVVVRFDADIEDSLEAPGALQVKEFAPEMGFGCSVRTAPFLAATLTAYPQSLKEIPIHGRKMAVYYAMVRGASTGRIQVLPGLRDPLVSYSLPKNQIVQLYEGVQKLAHLLNSLNINKLYFPWNEKDPQRMRLANYHLFASVPCGENKALSAADSYGQIHGYKNLFVCDASLFCSAPGVNPQATIMAMARRNALHFIASKNAQF